MESGNFRHTREEKGDAQKGSIHFQRNGIPYGGVILFADWGLETEIDAKGTYGQKLSPEDVRMCFASTLAACDHIQNRDLAEKG